MCFPATARADNTNSFVELTLFSPDLGIHPSTVAANRVSLSLAGETLVQDYPHDFAGRTNTASTRVRLVVGKVYQLSAHGDRLYDCRVRLQWASPCPNYQVELIGHPQALNSNSLANTPPSSFFETPLNGGGSVLIRLLAPTGWVLFDTPYRDGIAQLPADLQSKTEASVPGQNPNDLRWSIAGDSLGCRIHTLTGEITAGSKPGVITVQARTPGGCLFEGALELVSCADCADCDQFGNGNVRLDELDSALETRFYLGRDGISSDAGYLRLRASTFTDDLSRPSRLDYFFTRSRVETIRMNGILRQIKAPQGLVEIQSDSAHRYALKFYPNSSVLPSKLNQLYTLQSGAIPSVTWTIENPSGASGGQQLRMSRSRQGVTRTWQSTFLPIAAQWELEEGDGLRRTRVWSMRFAPRRHVHQEVYQNGTLLHKQVRTYETFGWGEGLKEEVISPQSNPQITTYTYYTSGNTNGNLPLALVVYPSGYWEKFEYNTHGWVTRKTSQYLNSLPQSADNRQITYEYTSLSPLDTGYSARTPRTERFWVLNREMGRTYRIVQRGRLEEIQAVNLLEPWSSLNHSRQITSYLTSGPFADQPIHVQRYDGVLERREYQLNTEGTQQTNTVWTGQIRGFSLIDVGDGTKTVRVIGSLGEPLSQTSYDIVSNKLLDRRVWTYLDETRRSYRLTYLDQSVEEFHYDCCGLSQVKARDGTLTHHLYDRLDRAVGTSVDGLSHQQDLDALNRVRTRQRLSFAGTIMLEANGYDLTGRLQAQTNALGGVHLWSQTKDAFGQTRLTLVYPDGGTRMEIRAQDGSLMRLTGTAVAPVRYEYGVEWEGADRQFVREIKLDAAESDTLEWTKTYLDSLGRAYKRVYASALTPNPTSQRVYNNRGFLEKEMDPDGVTQLYQFNGKGELEYTSVDMDGSQRMEPNGVDRIRRTVSDLSDRNGVDVHRQRTFEWTTDGVDSPLLVETVEEAVDGRQGWRTQFGLTESWAIGYDPANARRFETNITVQGIKTIRTFRQGRLESETMLDTSGNRISGFTLTYEGFGRVATRTDARTGAVAYTYNHADQILTLAEPPALPGQNGSLTQYAYDTLSRLRQVTLPDGQNQRFEFTPSGLLQKRSGAGMYPVDFSYDAQGRLKTLRTRQTETGGFALTTWNYDVYRGFVTNKRYADGTGPDYTYSPAGRVRTRTWARGTPRLSTTYSYNAAGEVRAWVHSDGSTPGLTQTFNRRGRRSTSTHNSGTTTFEYHPSGQVLSETHTGGSLGGYTVARQYDGAGRLNRISLRQGTTDLTSVQYGYDDASRLLSVTEGVYSSTNFFVPDGGNLISSTRFYHGPDLRLRTDRQWDGLNRLVSISNSGPSGVMHAQSQQYNVTGQLSRRTLADESYWVYTYDGLGQVTGGKRFWKNGTPVAGQQFEYTYDQAGNRTRSRVGGDASGTGLRESVYWPNDLNQYTSRTVPAGVDILGIAQAAGTVKVNGQATYRFNEYFQTLLNAPNTGASAYPTVTVELTTPTGFAVQTGSMFVAQTPELYRWDEDGNLLEDGRWVYTWDAENRLIGMETKAGVAVGARRKLEFEYDGESRRIGRKSYRWVGNVWTLGSQQKYLYDGWNMVGEMDSAVGMKSYVWGWDVSGTRQGAGGVGGLLGIKSGGNQMRFVAQDGQGNVSGLVGGANGQSEALYEYGPFGEAIRVSGSHAGLNPFRFSTKYTDEESDLLYYGYRFYNPNTGRWINRDPIGENGGANVYGMVGNSPISRSDLLGLYEVDTHRYLTKFLARHAGFCDEAATAIGRKTQALNDPGSNRDAMFRGRNTKNMKAYHFPSQAQVDLLREQAYMSCSKCEAPNLKEIGEYLHALQDTYSHSLGKGDRNWIYYDDLGLRMPTPKIPTIWPPGGAIGGGDVEMFYGMGHGLQGHRPDWTWEDPAKTMKMAELVFKELRELATFCGADCPSSPWESIQNAVSRFAHHRPSSFYKERIYLIWIENVTFEGYDQKIKLLDPTFSLDPIYKNVRRSKSQ